MKRIVHSAWLGRGWCRGWATLTVVLTAVGQSPAVTVTNTVTRPLPAYQKVVTPSSTCNNMVYWEARHAPALPITATVVSSVVYGVYVDDRAVLSGNGDTVDLGGCTGPFRLDDVIDVMPVADAHGAFDIVLQDSTTNGLTSNEVRLYGNNDITCVFVDPPPPEISDTNTVEETEDPYVEDPGTDDPSDDLPEDVYPGDVPPGDDDPGKDRPEGWDVSDDGGTVHENPHRVGCWCCDSEGSPRVLFDIANFNVRVEDTPVWHKNKVGAPLTLKMRFSNYGSTATNRTFGAKWSCQWNSSVTVVDAQTNRMVFPSGSIASFTQSMTDVYVPPSALTGVLLKTNGVYRYVKPDGWTWEYAQSSGDANVYLLSKVVDAWSNAISVTYTNNDRLYRVAQTVPDTGRYLEFAYGGSGARAISVSTEPSAQRTATFNYSAAGVLTNVVDMGGFAYSYAYDGGYLATVYKGASVRATVSYSALPATWTATNAYWVQLADAGGITNRFTWEFGSVKQETTRQNIVSNKLEKYFVVSTAGSRGRVITDVLSDGWQRQYQYNAQGLVTNRVDALGGTWVQTHNAQLRRVVVADPLGHAITNVYDANSVDLLYVQSPAGVRRVYTYVPGRHAVATESNALGRVVTNAYNSMGLLTNRYDGRTTDSYSYDYEGRLLAWVRNGEMLVTNSYDAFGRLEWSRNAAGLEIVRTYDDLNRPTSETYDNQGSISVNSNRYDCCFIDQTSNRNGRVWNYEYNDNGEKLSETNPDGLTTMYSFGVEGMPLVITNALEWTTRQYTPDGRLKRVAYPDNRTYDLAEHAENYWYDNAGHLTKRQTVSGAFYGYDYDLLGRLTAYHVPVETNLSVGVEAYVLALTNIYDAMGQAVWTRDIRGLAVSNEYNAIGQLQKVHYPDSTTEEWTYNPWGQVVGFKDRVNNVQSNVFDDRGRLIRHIDARQLVTYAVYTNADQLAVVSNSAGQVWRYFYDEERRATQLVFPDGATNTAAYAPLGNVTQYVRGEVVRSLRYDGQDRLAGVEVGGTVVESNRYDQLGRPVWQQNADGLIITNAWDSWGERMSSHGPGSLSETYKHGDRGLTNITDRLGIPVHILRDPLGRITNTVDGATNAVGYAFWSNGVNQLRYFWDGNANRTAWDYDESGNMTNKTYADNSTDRYQYDRLNRVTNKIDAAGIQTRYAYDAGGNLLSVAPGANPEIAFSYDLVGQPTNMTDGVGTTRWTYDAMGRMRTEIGPFGTVVSNSYDDAGRLTEVAFGGLAWTYQYDTLDRITNVVAPEGEYGFAYLQQGVRKASVRYPNGVVETSGYDDWTRTTNRTWLSGTNSLLTIGYAYDAGDRRTNEVWGSGRRMAYAYDRAYQLTNAASTNLAADNAGYRYDKAGNPLYRMESGLAVTNSFNSLNQIVNGTWTGGAVTVAGAVNYNAGTVTVNGAVANRVGLFYERTNVSLSVGTNVITAVYAGPPFGGVAAATAQTSVVVGNSTYGHDANGNLTNDASFAFQYDALNRLTNVAVRTNGASVLANRYDGVGRRVEAVRNSTNTERYVYFPGSFMVLAVMDGSNTIKTAFTQGPDLSGTLGGAGAIGGALSQIDYVGAGNTNFLHSDAMGNIMLATDPSRVVTATIYYGPFGKPIVQAGAFRPRFLYSSKEWEGSVGLYYYGYRLYSPALGQWLSRDPLGEQADPLHNLYRFVGNNPLNAVDPDGRQAIQNRVDFYMPGYGESQSYQMMGVNTRLLSVNNIQIYGATAQFMGRTAIEGSFVGDFETLMDPTANWIWKSVAVASIMVDAAGVGTVIPSTGAMRCAAKAATGTVQEGTTVFRVWGDEAGAWGRSWTTVDPRTVPGYRGAAGLPNQNTGRYISEGVLQDTRGITLKPADPLHGNAGGLPEVVIPNPQNQIWLQNVQGLNPEF